ncbi:MAG: bacillithiol biosynthesis deacetylase BshB1 [Calditrichaeota bacterium]|jgi:N-acetylglucosamine malate deacetylase 1|nr:bacillithiol biosynthesis deacetylase BshB1 [Calditrichota bacterium]MBT7788551.1 bacillithiol biosynthesis deacetylase BshB1 [Calditrichota bacterium]
MNFDIMAVSPHPDDVEIGCSGTLIQLIDEGYRVCTVEVTNAVLATGGDLKIRNEEAEASRLVMGAQKRFKMDMKEGELFPTTDNLYRLVSLIRKTRPHIVLAPYFEDRHPDHVATSKLMKAACFWSGVSKYGDNQAPHRPHRLVYYFLHWEGPISFIVDISATFDRKLQAIRAYHSQFLTMPSDRSMTYISRPEFLEKVINRARNYGSQIGVEYGEAFYTREVNRVDNLMTWADTQGVVG